MNAYSVMNNADIVSHEILPFLVAPTPSCCDRCKVVGTQLHLFKTPTAKHAFVVPPCLYEHLLPDTFCPRLKTGAEYNTIENLPKEIRTNDELMGQVKVSSVFGVENEWFCDGCWVKKVGFNTNYTSVHTAIKSANPDFDEKKVKKEIKLIADNELLFKTHRIKKTQEKAKLYEEYTYSHLRDQFAKVRKTQKHTAEAYQSAVNIFIQKTRQTACSNNSRHWIKEIRQRKIAKWFAERKISHKFHSYITAQMYNHYECPTWADFAKRYEGHADNENRYADQCADLVKSKQRRCPPLPEWWYKL
jgi:hypothetical protein